MTQVTVKELAQVVDTPVERLLLQMRDAGLPHTSAEQVVTDSEKQALLTHLKGSHGDRASEPRKITLQRKTTTTLKVGGSKTVSVEVRKKKTYVKRSPDEIEAERQRELEEQRAAEEAERLKAEEAAARQRAEEEARKAEEAARAKAAQEAAATAGAEPAVVADVAVAEPVAKPAAVEERKKEERAACPSVTRTMTAATASTPSTVLGQGEGKGSCSARGSTQHRRGKRWLPSRRSWWQVEAEEAQPARVPEPDRTDRA